MSEEINQDRRHFLGTAATTIAAAGLGLFGCASAQSRKGALSSLSSARVAQCATIDGSPSAREGRSRSILDLYLYQLAALPSLCSRVG